MTGHTSTLLGTGQRPEDILGSAALQVRKIGFDDIRFALDAGAKDFWDKPSHVVFLVLIYPIAGLILARLAIGYDVLPLLFPLVAGFALIGPFAALGLYEISRRRELGMDTSWSHAFEVLQSASIRSILALGAILMGVFLLWLALAAGLYALTLGTETPQSVSDFVTDVFSTRQGWVLIVLGNAMGFILAVFVLSISVVSFPLMLDRHVGVICAVKTSIAAVRANPGVLAVWGLVVAGGLVLGLLPLFVGLAIVLPLLGHATWHLYRRVVV